MSEIEQPGSGLSNFAAPALERRGFLTLGLAALLVAPAHMAEAASIENRLISLTNAARARRGLSPLRRDRRLEAAAARYAGKLAARGKLSHSVDGTRLSQRLDAARYNWRSAAENIAYHPVVEPNHLASSLIKGWLGSRGHARNIFDPAMRDIGTGLARSGARVYAVQLFGSKR